ncbi:hypothetical protein G7K_6507-t1 [Saitoella complicata NRRL Y-17804]|uniref:Uncharacterized protein n=1 Tax=Saitoella complicata (strain BCRC 22490 / CBS 7301 / JCM 7358 / NBRC 10748 / NRRL Y-17804) TaxID=698492 RepID=A0A0E9NRE8_SAICN|nr:hypothetical protein G7K_6507-t1 [Saitoella complicata NRRL Y-17804]
MHTVKGIDFSDDTMLKRLNARQASPSPTPPLLLTRPPAASSPTPHLDVGFVAENVSEEIFPHLSDRFSFLRASSSSQPLPDEGDIKIGYVVVREEHIEDTGCESPTLPRPNLAYDLDSPTLPRPGGGIGGLMAMLTKELRGSVSESESESGSGSGSINEGGRARRDSMWEWREEREPCAGMSNSSSPTEAVWNKIIRQLSFDDEGVVAVPLALFSNPFKSEEGNAKGMTKSDTVDSGIAMLADDDAEIREEEISSIGHVPVDTVNVDELMAELAEMIEGREESLSGSASSSISAGTMGVMPLQQAANYGLRSASVSTTGSIAPSIPVRGTVSQGPTSTASSISSLRGPDAGMTQMRPSTRSSATLSTISSTSSSTHAPRPTITISAPILDDTLTLLKRGSSSLSMSKFAKSISVSSLSRTATKTTKKLMGGVSSSKGSKVKGGVSVSISAPSGVQHEGVSTGSALPIGAHLAKAMLPEERIALAKVRGSSASPVVGAGEFGGVGGEEALLPEERIARARARGVAGRF